MAYAKTTWKNRVVQNPNTYLQQQNADGTVTLVPKEGTVTEAGTPVNAVNMNNIESGISSIDAANSIYSAGGTANAITITTANGDYSYAQFKKLSIKAASDNTGNVTINVDGKGAVPALKYDKSQLPAGAIKAGKVYDFYYDTANTCFFLIAKASGNAVAADVLAGKTFSNGEDTDILGAMDLKAENIREGVNYAGIIGTLKAFELNPGNNLLWQDPDEYSTSSRTYVRVGPKIECNIGKKIRIRFSLTDKATGSAKTYGIIYKNDTPIGQERILDGAQYGSLVYIEDFDCQPGDIFSFYIKTDEFYDVNAYINGIEVLISLPNPLTIS